MSPQTQSKHPTCWSMWSVSYHYTNQEHGVGEEVCELHYAHQHYKLPGVKHQVRRCLINLFFSLFKGWGPIAFLLHFHFCISKKSKSTCPFWVQGYTLKLLQKWKWSRFAISPQPFWAFSCPSILGFSSLNTSILRILNFLTWTTLSRWVSEFIIFNI